MKRLSVKTVMVLVAGVLCTGALVTNCSRGGGPNTSDVGHVNLALSVPGGFTINSVAYTVTSSTGATVTSGTVDVSGPGAAIAFDLVVPATAPGVTDTVRLTATSTSGRTFTGVSGPFTVISGQTTLVTVTLTDSVDGGAAPGQIDINATIVPGDGPPSITSVVVAPAQIGVGGLIHVSVTATDPDVGDTLSFLWTATAGSFVSPTAQSTTYTAPATPGSQTLRITVSDNHSPVASTTFIDLPITIVPVGGGTGGAGTGGAGTGGAGTGGAGTGGAGTGGAGTGGAGTGGAGTGGAGTGGAGTGGAGTGGAGTGGAGTGGAGTGGRGTGGAGTGGAGTGGAGTGGAGTGGAGTGGAGTGGAGTGGAGTGGAGGGAAFLACQAGELSSARGSCDPAFLTAQSDPITGDPIGFGFATLPTPAQQQTGEALLHCINVNNCPTDSTNTVPGNNPVLGCFGGIGNAPGAIIGGTFNGPCVAQYEAAATAAGLITAASTNAQIAGVIAAAAFDPTTPFGLADNIKQCAIDTGGATATACGQL